MLNRLFFGLVVNATHLLLAQAAGASAVGLARERGKNGPFPFFQSEKNRVKQVMHHCPLMLIPYKDIVYSFSGSGASIS